MSVRVRKGPSSVRKSSFYATALLTTALCQCGAGVLMNRVLSLLTERMLRRQNYVPLRARGASHRHPTASIARNEQGYLMRLLGRVCEKKP